MTISNPQIKTAAAAFARALLPPSRVRLSAWADEHRRLSSEASATPGKWSTLPYQVEILDAISPNSPYEQVVLMCASQMGKTEMLLNLVCYVVAETPGPVLVVTPTLNMGESWSKDRLAPAFRDTPILQGKVHDPKSRDAGSTIFHRRFNGGQLTLVGANSPAGLSARPVRFLLLDEIDRFEQSAGAEGDPIALATARTRAFWNRKIIMVSSPTTKGASRIASAYIESDQRVFEVPCPECDGFAALKWNQIEWPDGKPEFAFWRCPHCSRMVSHHRKARMIERGQWRAQNPSSRVAGFTISELYSPFRSWGQLAADWIAAQGNVERLRAFVNTSLAELWNDEGAVGVDEEELLARRENYGPMLPDRAAVITCGVDCQDDRLEASVWAWGTGEESWLMTHRVFPGDPSTPQLWAELDRFLLAPWQHPLAGPFFIHAVAIDSGGHFTQQVCSFCDERRGRRTFSVKGAAGSRPIWPRRQSKAARGKTYVIGVDAAKEIVAARLKIADDGPGRIHLPATVGIDFVEMLNSEFLRTKYSRGRPERSWERRPGRKAEAWDCAVYALAAVYALQSVGIHVDSEAAKLELFLKPGAIPEQAYRPSRSNWMGR